MSAVMNAQTKQSGSSNMTASTDVKNTSSGYDYSLIKKLATIQKVKDKYGLSEGMQVIHTVFTSYGTGIIDGFEVNIGQVAVRVEWGNVGSFDSPEAKKGSLHGPGILAKIDIDKDDVSGPNQGFKSHKRFLGKDK